MFDKDILKQAFDLAVRSHGNQKRKGTGIPFIAHPMAVASLVIEAGGSDHVVAAALLHDVVEDTKTTEDQIRCIFGNHIGDLVMAVTHIKIDWKKLKTAKEIAEALRESRLKYFERIRSLGLEVQLLSAADKLHNARSIYADLRAVRDEHRDIAVPKDYSNRIAAYDAIWNRFRGGRDGTIWYYTELAKVYSESKFPQVRQMGRLLWDITSEMRSDL